MFTKTTIALAIILGTASLAIAKEPKTSPAMQSLSGATYGHDDGSIYRRSNRNPDWAE